LGERLLCKQGVVGSIPIASMALGWRWGCHSESRGFGPCVLRDCRGAWRVGFGKRAPG
jgi:hypothetical protein